MEQVALVAVAAATYAIDKPYDYLVPASLAERAKVGTRVTVPFGRGNRPSEGVILALRQEESRRPELKVLAEVLDDESVLGPDQIKLALWLRERYFCTLYDAVKTLLPAGLWYRLREVFSLAVDRETALDSGKNDRESRVLETLAAHGGSAELETVKLACGEDAASVLRELCRRGLVSRQTTAKRKISDKVVKRVTLAVSPEEALAAVEPRRRAAPLRYEVIRLLAAAGSGIASDICYFTGASARTITGLEKSGLVTITEEEAFRVPKVSQGKAGPIVLTEEQQAVYDAAVQTLDTGKASCALLYGVTGSGKTAVYIRLLQEVVRRGRRGMILVPEIALTPQMMARFSAHFGDRVAMLHSGLRLSERYDQWKRVRRGDVDVVLGTRSAVFAPLDDLGMIILDEEHEDSYQSENPPRYHARDVAKYLCAKCGGLLVLGSATPSVETMYLAQTGIYHLVELRRRYNTQALPGVFLSDMKEEIRGGNGTSIGGLLRREIAANLERGEQTILFLNRRGASRMVSCGECGAVPTCPRCSVHLTYHSANGRLMCHYCGHSQPLPPACPACGGTLHFIGTGTQKVQEELETLFPGVEVLRMDTDTVSAAHSHEAILSRFEREKVPILVGTQMVAKGLDFENVTLVGVVAADLSLYVDSFRATERTFSLLTQVVGRAGRGAKSGRAVIQTYTPDNDVLRFAAAQDYDSFYAQEIDLRRLMDYPPFRSLFVLTASGADEAAVLRVCQKLRRSLELWAQPFRNREDHPRLLGPAPAAVAKVNNRYRYRLTLMCPPRKEVRAMLSQLLQAVGRDKESRGVSVFVDTDPYD